MEDFDELPKMAEWHETKLAVPESQHLSIGNLKPNYNIIFHRNNGGNDLGKAVGTLDFNGPEMKFTGDAEESAKVFIDWIATAFKGRLEEEYMRGYGDAQKEYERTGENE
jgi:hypothetical protein